MADQERGSSSGFTQMGGGTDEVGHVRREGRIGEFAFAGTEAGKVEAQHRNALCGERRRDAFRSEHILAAGEAMRKQCMRVYRSIRCIQRGGELMTAFAGELKAFRRHGCLLS